MSGRFIRYNNEPVTMEVLLRRGSTDPITGCIEWTGGKCNGYGRIGIDGKTIIVSRLVWELEKGVISDGLCVLHKCDNPPCFNVEHLFLGTKLDNSVDAARKGSMKRLPDDVVRQIRISTDGANVVAKQFGTNKKTVLEIRKGLAYPSVSA
jgi:hypothetical protein